MNTTIEMKRAYLPPTVESWQLSPTAGLLNTLSAKGVVEEWEQEESVMDESNYI